MIPFVLLASIPAMFTTMGGASDSAEQMVRSAKNGEFIAAHYPPGAYKRGEQGKVAFRLTIEPNGTIGTCDVTESSGFKSLDSETCEMMVDYARLQPVRSEDGRAIRAVQTGFITWKLPSGATAMASPSRQAMPKPNKLVCKREQTTGSLIATTRQCLTTAEWLRQERITRDAVEQLQGKDTIMQGN